MENDEKQLGSDLYFDPASNWEFEGPETEYKFYEPIPPDQDWECYMYGSIPGTSGSMVYHPSEGQIPNWFVRYFMKVFLGCTWVRK